MNAYFHGSVRQHIERAHVLLSKIPVNLPQEFHLLAQHCNHELDEIIDGFRDLVANPQMDLPSKQPERLRLFQKLVTRLNVLETVGIAALERFSEADIMLNQLMVRIKEEIAYPLLPPVVSSLSQQYFHIYPSMNLLFVPLCESHFLLHLPDLYHEIAHPLVVTKYNPRVKPFQDAVLKSFDMVLRYVHNEKEKENRGRGPKRIKYQLHLWEESWWKWTIEFYCDLFAVYTIGPAFVWSHFHLCAKLCDEPFMIPQATPASHPADNARMEVLLYALKRAGFGNEMETISNRWQEFIKTSVSKLTPEYNRCYPDHILESLAQHAYEGVNRMGCRIATPETRDPVYMAFNQAWVEFWKDPKNYAAWERGAVERLRLLCSSDNS